MARRNRNQFHPGVAHRTHQIKTFTEQVPLSSFTRTEVVGSLTLQKVYYSRANVIYRCDPDLTNHEAIYTWAGETGYIAGLEVDHVNLRIIAVGNVSNKVLAIDYDGSNPVESVAITNFFQLENPTVIDDQDMLLIPGPSGIVELVASTLAYVGVWFALSSSSGMVYVPSTGKVLYASDDASDDIYEINDDATGNTLVVGALGGVISLSHDLANSKLFFGDTNGNLRQVDYPTPGAATTWLALGSSSRVYEMEFDAASGKLYAQTGDSATASENGISIFTDTDQAASAHGVDADYSYGDVTRNGYGLALQYGTPWQAGGGGSAFVGIAQLAHSIPKGAMVLGVQVKVPAGFTGDTSAVVAIGDGSDEDRFNTGTPSVFAAAPTGVDVGEPSGDAFLTAAVQPTLRITSDSDFASVAAGRLLVTVQYVEP